MKQILSFIIATSITVASFAQATEQNLSEKVKITFPSKPELKEVPNGPKLYTAKVDSLNDYIGLAIDLSPMGLTEDAIAGLGDGIWDMVKGQLGASLGGAEIISDSVQQFKGKSSLYLHIDGTNSTNDQFKGRKAFIYMFFNGVIMHQILFTSKNPAAKKEDAKIFFDSVVISN